MTLCAVQTTQALLPYLPVVETCTMMEVLTAQVLSLPVDMPRNYMQGEWEESKWRIRIQLGPIIAQSL